MENREVSNLTTPSSARQDEPVLEHFISLPFEGDAQVILLFFIIIIYHSERKQPFLSLHRKPARSWQNINLSLVCEEGAEREKSGGFGEPRMQHPQVFNISGRKLA